MTQAPCMRTKDVADRWRCSQRTVRNLIKAGKLPCLRIESIIRTRVADLIAFEERRFVPAGAKGAETAASELLVEAVRCKRRMRQLGAGV